jgi:hypothetical protein
MTCTANATKIARPVNAARMMYVLVLKLTRVTLPPAPAAKGPAGGD